MSCLCFGPPVACPPLPYIMIVTNCAFLSWRTCGISSRHNFCYMCFAFSKLSCAVRLKMLLTSKLFRCRMYLIYLILVFVISRFSWLCFPTPTTRSCLEWRDPATVLPSGVHVQLGPRHVLPLPLQIPHVQGMTRKYGVTNIRQYYSSKMYLTSLVVQTELRCSLRTTQAIHVQSYDTAIWYTTLLWTVFSVCNATEFTVFAPTLSSTPCGRHDLTTWKFILFDVCIILRVREPLCTFSF